MNVPTFAIKESKKKLKNSQETLEDDMNFKSFLQLFYLISLLILKILEFSFYLYDFLFYFIILFLTNNNIYNEYILK